LRAYLGMHVQAAQAQVETMIRAVALIFLAVALWVATTGRKLIGV
jgi:hypothetical protein